MSSLVCCLHRQFLFFHILHDAVRQGHAVVLQRANGYGLPRGHVYLTCLVLRRADFFLRFVVAMSQTLSGLVYVR